MITSVVAYESYLPDKLRDYTNYMAFFQDFIPTNKSFRLLFYEKLKEKGLLNEAVETRSLSILVHLLERFGVAQSNRKTTSIRVHPITLFYLRKRAREKLVFNRGLSVFLDCYRQYCAMILDEIEQNNFKNSHFSFAELNNLLFVLFKCILLGKTIEDVFVVAELILARQNLEARAFQLTLRLVEQYQLQVEKDLNEEQLLDYAGCLDKLALYYRQNGAPEQSLEICLSNLDRLRYKTKGQLGSTERNVAAILHTNIAVSYRELKQFKECKDHIEQTIQILHDGDRPDLLANAFFELGTLYKSKKDFQMSEEYYLKATNLSTDNAEMLAKILFNLGAVYDDQRKWKAALESYFKALAFYLRTNQKHTIGLCYMNIALAYENEKNYKKAIANNKLALEVFLTLNAPFYVGQVFQNLAVVHLQMKAFEDCLSYLEKALQYYELLEQPLLIAEVYQNIGEVYRFKNQPKESISYGQRALILFSKNNDTLSAAKVLQNVGIGFYMQDQYEESQQYFEQALELYYQHNDQFQVGTVFQNLALIAKKLNNYKAGKSYLIKALDQFLIFKDLYQIGWLVANANTFSTHFSEKEVLIILNDTLEANFAKEEMEQIIGIARQFITGEA